MTLTQINGRLDSTNGGITEVENYDDSNPTPDVVALTQARIDSQQARLDTQDAAAGLAIPTRVTSIGKTPIQFLDAQTKQIEDRILRLKEKKSGLPITVNP